MWPSMYPRNIRALQAEALFVSALQRSEELRVSQIREAIAGILVAYGGAGCAGRVARELATTRRSRPFGCAGPVPRRLSWMVNPPRGYGG
jgi:hypothetical protein